MIDPRTASFVLSVESLEEQAIFELLKPNRSSPCSRYDVRNLADRGGWRPLLSAVERQRLLGTVVLINCPDPDVADDLRADGRRVVAIDHRRRLDGANWRGEMSARTSLEQVEDLLGMRSKRPDRARIIAEARGGVTGLARHLWREIGGAEPPDRKAERQRDWRKPLDVKVEPQTEMDLQQVPDPPPPAATPRWHSAYEAVKNDLWELRDDRDGYARARLGGEARWRDTAANREHTLVAIEAGRHIAVRAFATGRHVESDPELMLALAPERYRLTLQDAVIQWSAESRGVPPTRPIEILALFVGDDDAEQPPTIASLEADLVRLELHAGAARLPLIEELLGTDARRALGLDQLEIASTCTSERLTLSLAASPDTDVEQQRAISRFADRLLDELLIGNRPLRAWRTSFLQPMQINGEERYRGFAAALVEDAAWKPVEVDAEERAYITPALRPYVMPNAEKLENERLSRGWPDGTLRSFQRDLYSVKLELIRAVCDDIDELPVTEVRVHLLANRTVLIEWTSERADKPVEGSKYDMAAREEARRTWRQYLSHMHDKRRSVPCLAQVVDWNASARFVYSSFQAREADPGEEHEYRRLIRLVVNGEVLSWLNHGRKVSPGEPGHGHFFQALLLALLGEGLCDVLNMGSETCTLLADDRSRVISSIVPYGNQPHAQATAAEVEALRARLHMVEPYGGPLPYDESFSAKEVKEGRYNRFASFGTWYGLSSHSFVCLSYGSYGWVVHRHMGTIYRRLFVLTLMQRAVLHAYGLAIAGALHRWKPDRQDLPKAYQELRPGFLRFTNVIWLREVSSQVQGVELFERMQAQLGLEAEHARIADEIDKTDSYCRERREAWRDQLIRIFTFVGAPFAAFAATWGWSDEDEPGFWHWIRTTLALDRQCAALLAAAVTVLLILTLTRWLWFRRDLGGWRGIVMTAILVVSLLIVCCATWEPVGYLVQTGDWASDLANHAWNMLKY